MFQNSITQIPRRYYSSTILLISQYFITQKQHSNLSKSEKIKMLKVTTRPSVQTAQLSTQLPIIFKREMPNRLKMILKDLYYPVPRFFNIKILRSKHCLEILQYVISWPSLDDFSIDLQKNHGISNTPLLKQIASISFLNLQQLYLENIKLDNFQLIQFIECQDLKILYLMRNDSRTLKSLAKTNWKKLQKIEIDGQLGAQQLISLERMKMSTNGRVINPYTDGDAKKDKKNDQSQIHDSLMLIWPKLQGKRYAHLIEERIIQRKKRS